MSAKGEYYAVGPNMYVPNMAYAADVFLEGKPTINLTPIAPVAVSTNSILNGQSIAVAGSTSTFAAGFTNSEAQMGKFGRALQLVASGAAVSAVTVHGFDYLGQPMSEQFVLNGATAVLGAKTFRRISRVDFGATAGTTINLGWRDVFGMPYAYLDAGVDFVDGAKAGTQGGFSVPPLGAQTGTTADPRGLYIPSAGNAPNGARKYVLQYEVRKGDLYGQRHFFNG